jgi:hypothetical protein
VVVAGSGRLEAMSSRVASRVVAPLSASLLPTAMSAFLRPTNRPVSGNISRLRQSASVRYASRNRPQQRVSAVPPAPVSNVAPEKSSPDWRTRVLQTRGLLVYTVFPGTSDAVMFDPFALKTVVFVGYQVFYADFGEGEHVFSPVRQPRFLLLH